MPTNNTIQNLKRELIRAFAELDSWFDKDERLHVYKSFPDDQPMYEAVNDIIQTNNDILSLVEDGCKDSLNIKQWNYLNNSMSEFQIENLEIEDPAVHQFLKSRVDRSKISTDVNSIGELRFELRDQLDRCLCNLELLGNGEGTLFSATLSTVHTKKINAYQWIQLISFYTNDKILQLKKLEVHFGQIWQAVD